MVETQADIQIFNQTALELPVSLDIFKKIAAHITDKERCGFKLLEVVYVDEEKILTINREHLDHDYVTDIITFRYDDNDQEIEGTLFCCAPRIKEQAREFDESEKREFFRIYTHGLLHLAGYEDKTDPQKQQMRNKENAYLELIGL